MVKIKIFDYSTCMIINNFIQNNIQSFKAATISINAFSDTHGELSLASCALEEIRNHQNDIFLPEEKGKRNVLAVCGDWYMDGGKTGYKSNPDKKLGYFQNEMFNSFISEIKKIAANVIPIFTPGNHEFDGGVPLLDDILSNLDSEILITNLNIPCSDGFNKTRNRNKLINQYILEVEDDKNPELKHQILFLGISPVNLLYYQKNLCGVKLTDNILKPQAKVQKDDYSRTLNQCKLIIDNFKQKNPDGFVILMSHTGVGFADNLAKEAPVDLVFDGHEHKTKLRKSNKTPIIPLSKNFQKIINAKLEIDDDGKLKDINIISLHPKRTKQSGILFDLYKDIFRDDMEEIYTIKTPNSKIKTLSDEGVRTGNNYLANFVTDSVLEELRKKDNDIDFFALNSSAIRHPLKAGNDPAVSSFDIMNVLVGIKEEDGNILTTVINGEDLIFMILDNFLFNREKPLKNSLIQYAGLDIDKTKMLQAYDNGASLSELACFVTNTRTNKPIEINQIYKIANVEKYFMKSQNPQIKATKHISKYTGNTVQELFIRHFEQSEGVLFAKCDTRLK